MQGFFFQFLVKELKIFQIYINQYVILNTLIPEKEEGVLKKKKKTMFNCLFYYCFWLE